MKCHLVYAVPTKSGKLARFFRNGKIFLQHMGIPISAIGKRTRVNTYLWPKKSPYTNTKYLYKGLSTIFPTLLYDLNEHIKCKFDKDDIFLGHPIFPYSRGVNGVTNISIYNINRPRIMSIISPLHCEIKINTRHINKAYLDSIDKLFPNVDLIFGIMGEYWWDKWDSSPYAHWKKKMVRLDMAINTKSFPRVKHRFNPKGKRGFIYIGRNDPMKGIDFLSTLMANYDSNQKGWIGSGPEIPNIPRISKHRTLTTEFISEIGQKFDFFITVGIADPNPTTILESMAWGFPVICTPESGYYKNNCITNVFNDDINLSLKTLKYLQYADEDELVQLSDKARIVVEKYYTWEKFLSTVSSSILNLIG